MNYDKLVNAPSKGVAKAVMKLVDRLQSFPPEIQTVASCVLFAEVCRAHRVDQKDVFTVAANLTADTIHGERPELRAVRLYCKHELT